MQKEKTERRKQFEEGDVTIFGRLTLTGKSCIKTINGKYKRFVEAICICGVIRDYRYNLLIRGDTKSCGCLRREVVSKRMSTHGLTKHPLYDVWGAMKQRCGVPEYADFKNYGERGIAICDEWYNSFEEFYEWCINNGWAKGLELDRIDNNGHYEPNNCRFVTRPVSNRNTRRTRLYTAFGETKCLFDWGKDERCKISVWGLRNRMDRGKWVGDFESALTAPEEDKIEVSRNKKSNKYFTAFGETKCMSAWLEDARCLVKIDSFRDRLAKGWDAEKTMSTPPSRDGKNKKTVIALARY